LLADAGPLNRVNVFALPPGAVAVTPTSLSPDECVVGVRLGTMVHPHSEHRTSPIPIAEDMQNYWGKTSIGCAVTGILSRRRKTTPT